MLADLTEVDSFLRTIATPEYRALVQESLQAFDNFMYSDHVSPMLNAVLVDDTANHESVLDTVNSLLFEHLDIILRVHHITVQEDTPLYTQLKLVQAIYLMQAWLDQEGMIALASSDASAEERFAAIVQLTTGFSEERVLDILEEVDDGLLKRLVQVLAGDTPSDASGEDVSVSDEQLQKLRVYRNFTGSNKLLAFRLIRLGYRVGYEFDRYLTKALPTLDGLTDQQLTDELLGIILLSSDGWSQPVQCWRDKTQALMIDIGERAKVDVLMMKTVTDFMLYYNNSKNQGEAAV